MRPHLVQPRKLVAASALLFAASCSSFADALGTFPQPVEALASPSGRYVYSISRVGARVQAFESASNGFINPVGSSDIQPNEIDAAISPDGRFLAVASTTSGIETFTFNTDPLDSITDGTPMSTGFVTTPLEMPMSIEFDASGRFLYVGLATGGIQTLQVAANGELLATGTTSSGDMVIDMALRLAVR